MKKILIVSDYLDNIWGIETYINNLKILLKDDFEVYYFWWKNITKFKKIWYLIKSFYNKKYAKKFKKTIDEIKPDIIWFHSTARFLGPEVVKQVKNFKGLKIVTYHDLWYFHLFANELWDEKQIPQTFSLKDFLKTSKKWKILFFYSIFKYLKLKSLKKYLYECMDFHTVPSNFMKDIVIKLNYAPKDKVEVLSNYILKRQIIEKKDIYQDKINFIYFWRLEKEKWFWLIIYFLSQLWELKFKNRKKYEELTSKIRIFIFWDGKRRQQLLESFDNKDIYWNDIWIIKNLENEENILNKINENDWKFIYYLWKRDFNIIKEFLSFSHYELVPSLFLETFWLSAVEWAANQVIPIWFNKENIKNFLLDEYKLDPTNPAMNFSNKIFDIIENFDLETWKKQASENKKLIEKYII